MRKLVALIYAKPGLSRDAFIQQYESGHVPLVRELLPMISEYRRSYVRPDAQSGSQPLAIDFDAVTELWFDDQEALDAFWQKVSEPEVLAKLREDEAKFLVSERTQLFQVDEYGRGEQPRR